MSNVRKQMELRTEEYVNALKEIFPALSFQGSVSLYNGEEPSSASVSLSIGHGLMKNTPFEFNGDDLLIHYTTLPSLFEIVKSAKLRLYSASSQNDPMELLHIKDHIPELELERIEEERNQLFTMSFCKYERNDYPDSFNMWRLYGNNGLGVGIVFKLLNCNVGNWFDCYLGRVDYGKENSIIQNIKQLFQINERFRGFPIYKIENIPRVFFLLSLFNKTSIWSDENEIRLIQDHYFERLHWLYGSANGKLHSPLTVFPSSSINGNLRYYTELRLDHENRRKEINRRLSDPKEQKAAFDLYPQFKIEQIVLGYNVNKDIAFEITNVLNRMAEDILGYRFPITGSIYTDYFQPSR